VFLGSFTNQQEAEAFLSKRIRPLLAGKKGPSVQRLPYTLHILKTRTPARDIQVALKPLGLNPFFENNPGEGGRMLLGAFKNPREARAAAEILSREKIAYRLVAR